MIKNVRSATDVALFAAKPFPSSYSIGHDVCEIRRIAFIMRYDHRLQNWARRVFTRLEWPLLVRRFQQAGGEIDNHHKMRHDASGQKKQRYDEDICKVPMLPEAVLSRDTDKFEASVADLTTPLRRLASHLAGRFDRLRDIWLRSMSNQVVH